MCKTETSMIIGIKDDIKWKKWEKQIWECKRSRLTAEWCRVRKRQTIPRVHKKQCSPLIDFGGEHCFLWTGDILKVTFDIHFNLATAAFL